MTSREDLKRIFNFALQQEYTGKSFFETSLDRMGMGASVSAFRKLIEEEEKHITFIQRILKRLESEEDFRVEEGLRVEPEVANYFDERARSEFLQKGIQESMIPDVTVFNTAWLIEKDLSDFYANMASRTDGEASKSLRMLADWEKAHEEFFREYRDALSDAYSRMPWGG